MLEHRTVSLADRVFEQLENDILTGKYKRGEILTETGLSAELGVSRTPIREALRSLEQEHLIEESGKGSVVIGISESDLDDIFLIRKQLEGLAARAAAERRSDAQLEKLKEVLELQEFYLSKKDPDRIKLMDSQFHEQVYILSGSIIFSDILIPLHRKIQKYRKASVESGDRALNSVKEHRAIYEAIRDGDGDRAEKLTSEHVNNAYLHIKAKGKE